MRFTFFSAGKPFRLSILFVLFSSTALLAQDPTRFAEEIRNIETRDYALDTAKDVVVFTGSSSIRMWTVLQEQMPHINAINTGFGGSQFNDLIYYKQSLIYRFRPHKVFIYEGDNDIAAGEDVLHIAQEALNLINDIKLKLPDTEIYILSAKPSISRWSFKDEYLRLNALLEAICDSDDQLEYVDVWTPMLNGEGVPMPDIFIEDDLHMNEKGYLIWKETIKPFTE